MIKNGCGGGGARGPLLKGLARRLWKHHEPNILIHFIAVSQSKVFVCNNSHCCFLRAALFVVVRSFILSLRLLWLWLLWLWFHVSRTPPIYILWKLDEAPDDFHPSPMPFSLSKLLPSLCTYRYHHPFGATVHLIKKKNIYMKRISYRKFQSASLLA